MDPATTPLRGRAKQTRAGVRSGRFGAVACSTSASARGASSLRSSAPPSPTISSAAWNYRTAWFIAPAAACGERHIAAAWSKPAASRPPFSADAFDVVVSSYVLDLLAIPDIEAALAEFYRVLRPAGRVVLVNLTKIDQHRTTWYERCYRLLPAIAQAYLLGGCRPVQLEPITAAAGFAEAHRTVVRQFLSSEIVVAVKPYRGDRPVAA